jgi:hypothetical protein
VASFLLAGLITQHLVLSAQAAGLYRHNARWSAQASHLRQLGVRPPCILGGGYLPVAYYLGCTPTWADQHLPALLARPPGPGAWRQLHDPSLRFRVYVRK